jgi:gamma-glutamyltranspeptidase / glutathione hydrolase
LKSMGFNSARYIHTLYQVMNLAYADRDFYYGDPYFPPQEPMAGLLSKAYAKERDGEIDWKRNDPNPKPGDPYPFEGKTNPYLDLLRRWQEMQPSPPKSESAAELAQFEQDFRAGTTSVLAADEQGWVVSMTPSGGWVPVCIAGHTGVGMSQRMQSFVLDAAENPFNVVAPGKRPRATLTPTLALKDGKPYIAAAVQGGDSQDQNLLQFFLDVVEFGMNVQQACEAPNINSYEMRSSFGDHSSRPGRIEINASEPPWVRDGLEEMGYTLEIRKYTSGPINAIVFDREHGTMWGGSSNYGEDYGVSW